jgi:Fe-S-cluster containining protein
MPVSKALQALYDKIPKGFQCAPGCNLCCGPVPHCAEEAALIDDDDRKRMDVSKPCPFTTPQGCAIYDKRPFMCRIFGCAPDMLACPHGLRPERMLTDEEASDLTDEYITKFIKG